MAMSLLQNGAGRLCPNNDCGPRWNPNVVGERGSQGAIEFFHAFGNGYGGWMTSYGLSHYEGGSSYSNSADDAYNENDSRLTRSRDFGHGLPQNPERKMTSDEIVKIRENIAALLTDKCKDFINNLISIVKGSPYDSGKQLLVDYDKVAKAPEGGMFFKPMTNAGGLLKGQIDSPTAAVFLPSYLSGLGRYDVVYAAHTTIHELIHLITNKGDPDLSKYVYDMGLTDVPVPTEADVKKNGLVFSGYWGGLLKGACMPKGY
jgi:hypothetical protein